MSQNGHKMQVIFVQIIKNTNIERFHPLLAIWYFKQRYKINLTKAKSRRPSFPIDWIYADKPFIETETQDTFSTEKR